MKNTTPHPARPLLVVTTSNQRRKRNQSEERRIADHTRPRWWVHAHINTRATDAPGTLAATVADQSTRADFEDYLTETRTMRRRSQFERAQVQAHGFAFSF